MKIVQINRCRKHTTELTLNIYFIVILNSITIFILNIKSDILNDNANDTANINTI